MNRAPNMAMRQTNQMWPVFMRSPYGVAAGAPGEGTPRPLYGARGSATHRGNKRPDALGKVGRDQDGREDRHAKESFANGLEPPR